MRNARFADDTAQSPDGKAAQDAAQRRDDMRTIRKVIPYIWPKEPSWVRYNVVAAMAMLVLSKLASVTTPFFYKAAVDNLAPEGDPTSFFLIAGAVGLTVAYGMARLMTTGFQQLRDAIFAPVGQRALRRLALETFNHIHDLSLRYHLTRKTGGLSRIMERGVKGVEFLLRYLVFSLGPLLLELVMIAIILAVTLDFSYLVIVVGTIAVYMVFTYFVTEWRVRIRREMNKQDTQANQKAIDSLLNYETVKYFSAEARESKRYDVAMRAYAAAALKTSYSLAFLNFGQGVIITCGLVSVMVMAALGVQSGALTVGDFVLVNAFMIQITLPLNFLGSIYREIRQSLVDMSEMFTLLEQPREVTDKPDAPDLVVSHGALRLSNVDFGYDPDRQILRDVTIDVAQGETVAIVGPSGSGKSTIGRLLFRFYDVGAGALTIDGQDVRDVTQASLRRSIGVVPQDTVLFNDTIGYNIAYGRDNASQADVIDAAKRAQIHEFITSLPAGYDTTVGERGLKLSGGEKQRVGIARTLLKNPPILLLDEATSALDSDTEAEIQDALRAMGQGRTVITIAHRLSTIVDADKIVVLAGGVVEDIGRHDELLARGGRYAHLWNLQAAEE